MTDKNRSGEFGREQNRKKIKEQGHRHECKYEK